MARKLREWINTAADMCRKRPWLLFVMALLLMAWAYDYPHVAFLHPQSIHRWRQTDCTSITLNFYQHGMHFFRPEVHSLVSDGNATGYAAGEAPLLYYLVALLYKVFGTDDVLYRILNTLVFLAGLWALFKMAGYVLRDHFLAAFTALLIFTSPVAAYYGCNYLPDTTSFSLALFGWWQVVRHRRSGRYGPFLLAVLFFAVAGLLKVTMAMNLIAVIALVVLQQMNWPLKRGELIPVKPWKAYLPFLVALMMIAAWYLYARYFNRIHSNGTFLTSVNPWWKLDTESRKPLTEYILDHNITMYFSRSIWIFLLACLVLIPIGARSLPSWLLVTAVLLLAGGFMYVNLWYVQFQYHDYYFIILFMVFVFLMLAAFSVLRTRWKRFSASWPFRLALLALLTGNVFHARAEMQLRYHGWKLETPHYEEYFTIRPYLQSIGIQPEDRVISIPDVTSCYTLYMMNRQGNNLPGINPYTAERIREYIRLGAKYLFVNDSTLLQAPELQDFLGDKRGQTGQVSIYRLDPVRMLTPSDPGSIARHPEAPLAKAVSITHPGLAKTPVDADASPEQWPVFTKPET